MDKELRSILVALTGLATLALLAGIWKWFEKISKAKKKKLEKNLYIAMGIVTLLIGVGFLIGAIFSPHDRGDLLFLSGLCILPGLLTILILPRTVK